MAGAVRHDSEILADGQQVFTACAFIHHKFDGVVKVFLAKRAYTKKFLPGVYELPGGHIDYGEDMASGLVREIREEFGMCTLIGDPFFVLNYMNDIKRSHSLEVIYFAQFAKPLDQISIQPDDHAAFGWFAEDEIHKAYTPHKGEDDAEFQAIRRGFALLRGEPIDTLGESKD